MNRHIVALIIALLMMVVLAKQNVQSYRNNYYVILSTSKFFFNYRHSLNAIMFYQYLKSRGIDDDNILLMIPTDHACSSKNAFPGTLYGSSNHDLNWVCEDIEIDYKAEDLNSDAILNMMRGRYDENFPLAKRMLTNVDSRIFMYWNGHGGENFFKI